MEINDEQEPDADHTEIRIETPAVAFEFANPIQTTRIGKGKGQTGRLGQEGDSSDSPENTGLEVSTDEASTHGTLPSADYDGLEDKSDDAHLYSDKFEAFDAMVKQLVTMSGCRHIHREIRKLPTIDGYSKHLLVDGNPRCVAFHRIKKDGQEYALIEVDTSDNKNRLSTLLLKSPSVLFNWGQFIHELEIRLVRGSLVWPKKYLKMTFDSGYKRISHPSSNSKEKSILNIESITRWSMRVYESFL